MSDGQAPSARRVEPTRSTAGGCALSLVGGALIVFGQIAWGHVQVFHSRDVTVVVITGLLVLEGAALGLVLRIRPDVAARIRGAPWTAWFQTVLAVILLGVMLPAGLVLWLNQSLDSSLGTTRTLPIREKWIRTYKGNSRACFAGVAADIPRHPPIVFPWSRDIEPIALPCTSYGDIVPERSQVLLFVHPGAFGLPWYDHASLMP